MLKERIYQSVNAFANITPEKHQEKVNQYRLEANELRKRGNNEPWEMIDGASVFELGVSAVGFMGAGILAGIGIENLTSMAENSDASKGILGVVFLALAIRLAKVPIRAIDSSNAAIEVVNEELFTNKKNI